jgi:hypothetical protein
MLARAQPPVSIAFQLLLYPKLDFVNTYPAHEENRALGLRARLAISSTTAIYPTVPAGLTRRPRRFWRPISRACRRA